MAGSHPARLSGFAARWVAIILLVATSVALPARADTTTTCSKIPPQAHFPLKVASTGRYLEDASGTPFLMIGDAAWSLIAGLTREDADVYLQDRRCRGFNTLLVNLIEYRFLRDPPRNAYRTAPFTAAGDFTSLNDAYFDHAEWVIGRAEDLGFLVLLAPAYLGFNGAGEGWSSVMSANGKEALRGYGEAIGARFARFHNIVWVLGGDADPPDKGLIRALDEGLRLHDQSSLRTVHNAPETDTATYWAGESWLDLTSVYTYGPVHSAVLAQHRRGAGKPYFHIESAYENEHGITTQKLRAQAYEAFLGGACGSVFGNNPIWHFSSGGLFPASTVWRDALASPGARGMTHLRSVLHSRAWWRLRPLDLTGHATSAAAWPLGSEPAEATGAAADDGSFVLIYVNAASSIGIDPDTLRPGAVVARWFDPADGTHREAFSATPDAGGTLYSTPGRNSTGDTDWVLILTAATKATQEQHTRSTIFAQH